MSQLLAIAFDAPASPAVTLLETRRAGHLTPRHFGWGMAWYPPQDKGAVVMKDPIAIQENAMTRLLRDWERFRSTIFICHLRGAAQRVSQEDTQPFGRYYAGREWVMAHNGQLRFDFAKSLKMPDDPMVEPLGHTDTEYLLCWLLGRLKEAQVRELSKLEPDELHAWFEEINAFGTLNLLLSDGQTMIDYQDASGFNPLYWTRRNPPHSELDWRNDEVELKLGAQDGNRTVFVVATEPLSASGWQRLAPGQMLVVRRGAIVFDSEPSGAPEAFVAVGRSDSQAVPERSNPLFDAEATPSYAASASPFLDAGADPPLATAGTQAALGQGGPTAPLAAHADGSAAPLASVPRPFEQVTGASVASSDAPSAVSSSELARQSQRRRAPQARQRDLEVEALLKVTHETIYRYREAVDRSEHLLRLRPVHDSGQHLLRHTLQIEPPSSQEHFEDVFGNAVVRLEPRGVYSEMRFVATSIVRVLPPGFVVSRWRRSTIPLDWMPWQRQMMSPYLLPPELPETQLRELFQFGMGFVDRQDFDLVAALQDLNRTIHRDFAYVQGATTLATTPFQVYATRRGVCQDFATLFITLSRLLGVPARYRVGYIYTGTDYLNRAQSDASHAWVEVYLPWAGWRGFDPTNGSLSGLDHVRVACGRNYVDATPTSGTIYRGGGGEVLEVSVQVERLDELPSDLGSSLF
ncbi:MAG: class II glutamine amidotransferase [Myxococcales bacterium]|nr:class II glutamine amidotransferase [Myxococcales bacterium]